MEEEEEIINSRKNNIIDINKPDSNQDNIQVSFNDYFISILKELPDYFIKYSTPKRELDIKRYLKENNENKGLSELLPINIINPKIFINLIKK